MASVFGADKILDLTPYSLKSTASEEFSVKSVSTGGLKVKKVFNHCHQEFI